MVKNYTSHGQKYRLNAPYNIVLLVIHRNHYKPQCGGSFIYNNHRL